MVPDPEGLRTGVGVDVAPFKSIGWLSTIVPPHGRGFRIGINTRPGWDYMRISTLLFAVLVIATILAIVRDEVGRVAVIVFFTGLGACGGTLTAIMALFQTVGALGEARTLGAHVEALASTLLVLVVASTVILGVMFAGAVLVQWAIP